MQKLKLWYGVSQRYAAGQDFERLPFTKVISRRSKLPLKLKPFKVYLEGSVYDRRMALTVLSIFRIIIIENNTIDYSQIEAPRRISRDFDDLNIDSDKSYLNRIVSNNPTTINKKLLRSWKHCINTMFPHSSLSYRKRRLFGDNLYISNKNGPNGPALGGIALDFEAMKGNGLINDVYYLSQLTNNQSLKFIVETFYTSDLSILEHGKQPIIASKLSLKQEPGGKNRLFAIGDYFTQSSLKSLHNYLFEVLKGLPEDGTHSHNYVSQICKIWSDSPINRIYSMDLTGATNFIDCEVLGEIVQSIAGKEYAKHWVNLMVNRDFTCSDGNTRRYTVGQPMGFLSSWAMLAIWNHLMVRTCRHALGLHPLTDDPQFVIIGDDVAILREDVAHMYSHLCELMGVPLSHLKGFSPSTKAKVTNPIRYGSTMNSVEIAKRIFVDGLELSPISPVEITSGLESSYTFPALLLSLAERGINTTNNKEYVLSLASRTPNYITSLDVALFPMAPSLNWVEVTNENKVNIIEVPSSFWNGLPYPLISQLFYVYIKQRINRAVETINKTLMSFYSSTPESTFTCKEYRFTSIGYATCMRLIANAAGAMSNDILSRISLVGENHDQLDNSLEAQVEKSRGVRRTIGLITCLFDLESLGEISQTSRFEEERKKTDRLFTDIVKDIKVMFT